VAAVLSSPRRQLLSPLLERYACFNRILEITCGGSGGGDSSATSGDEILVFETARYGRNDTTGASRCQVPFARTCDLDVQHPMSKACGGRRRCSLAVNTAFFGDPCGYDEFLKVTYRCVPGERPQRTCERVYRIIAWCRLS
jgi:Galactose binding lectin domain